MRSRRGVFPEVVAYVIAIAVVTAAAVAIVQLSTQMMSASERAYVLSKVWVVPRVEPIDVGGLANIKMKNVGSWDAVVRRVWLLDESEIVIREERVDLRLSAGEEKVVLGSVNASRVRQIVVEVCAVSPEDACKFLKFKVDRIEVYPISLVNVTANVTRAANITVTRPWIIINVDDPHGVRSWRVYAVAKPSPSEIYLCKYRPEGATDVRIESCAILSEEDLERGVQGSGRWMIALAYDRPELVTIRLRSALTDGREESSIMSASRLGVSQYTMCGIAPSSFSRSDRMDERSVWLVQVNVRCAIQPTIDVYVDTTVPVFSWIARSDSTSSSSQGECKEARFWRSFGYGGHSERYLMLSKLVNVTNSSVIRVIFAVPPHADYRISVDPILTDKFEVVRESPHSSCIPGANDLGVSDFKFVEVKIKYDADVARRALASPDPLLRIKLNATGRPLIRFVVRSNIWSAYLVQHMSVYDAVTGRLVDSQPYPEVRIEASCRVGDMYRYISKGGRDVCKCDYRDIAKDYQLAVQQYYVSSTVRVYVNRYWCDGYERCDENPYCGTHCGCDVAIIREGDRCIIAVCNGQRDPKATVYAYSLSSDRIVKIATYSWSGNPYRLDFTYALNHVELDRSGAIVYIVLGANTSIGTHVVEVSPMAPPSRPVYCSVEQRVVERRTGNAYIGVDVKLFYSRPGDTHVEFGLYERGMRVPAAYERVEHTWRCTDGSSRTWTEERVCISGFGCSRDVDPKFVDVFIALVGTLKDKTWERMT